MSIDGLKNRFVINKTIMQMLINLVSNACVWPIYYIINKIKPNFVFYMGWGGVSQGL